MRLWHATGAYLQVLCLTRVRPASLGRMVTRKHVIALPRASGEQKPSPSQWARGGVECWLNTSGRGIDRDQEPRPIRQYLAGERSQILLLPGVYLGKTNSLTIPARYGDMYRYGLPRAYNRPAGIGAMTTGLK